MAESNVDKDYCVMKSAGRKRESVKRTKQLRNLFIVLSLLLSHAMCVVLVYQYRDIRCGIEHMGYSAPERVVFLYAIPFIIGIVICSFIAVCCHRKR